MSAHEIEMFLNASDRDLLIYLDKYEDCCHSLATNGKAFGICATKLNRHSKRHKFTSRTSAIHNAGGKIKFLKNFKEMISRMTPRSSSSASTLSTERPRHKSTISKTSRIDKLEKKNSELKKKLKVVEKELDLKTRALKSRKS
jgi:Sec-independent protein translocase protein TatA